MKVSINMEAEVGDLKAYAPDVPKGITAENVASTVVSLLRDVYLRALNNEASKGNAALRKAMKAHLDDDIKLIERLVGSIKVGVLKP